MDQDMESFSQNKLNIYATPGSMLKNQGKITDIVIPTVKKSDHYLDSRELSVQFWSQKFRQELEEVKKELRSLEKKQMRELIRKRLAQTRASRLDECFQNGISVYSSRTYIVGASHFRLVTDLPRKRDFSTSFKNRNMIRQKQITYLYSSPKTRGWGGIQHHTESQFSTKPIIQEKGFYWNHHFVSRKRKVLAIRGDLNFCFELLATASVCLSTELLFNSHLSV